jgi:GNAT superfamily N-acetyltransferase
MTSLQVIAVTDDGGNIIKLDWLLRAEAVHRQLRPHLKADYVARMREVFATGGRMSVAVVDDVVVGVAVYRIVERTFSGRELYCDDLVTDEARRSLGVGRTLIAHMEAIARARACNTYALDSGTQRQQAHKFYFREGFTVTSFHFVKPL